MRISQQRAVFGEGPECRALIFDFFGVICSEIAPFWLRRYFSEAEAANLKSGLIAEADSGQISQAELFAALGNRSGISRQKVEDEWWELVEIDQSIVDIICELLGRYQVSLLTNSPSPFVRQILSDYDLGRLFQTIVVSSEVGLVKPNPGIYHCVLAGLGIAAENGVMVDDNPVNIAGAEAVGLRGLLYRSPDTLARDLRHIIGI